MNQKIESDPEKYWDIIVVILASLAICFVAILVLNTTAVQEWLKIHLGERKGFVIQLFFWAALGATLSAYKFCADDKEINERECLKPVPNPELLRWPNNYDVAFYALRILFSGVQGIIGALILFAGLGFFDGSLEKWGNKEKLFFIVFAVFIGIYQTDFLSFLSGMKSKFFQPKGPVTSSGGGGSGGSSGGGTAAPIQPIAPTVTAPTIQTVVAPGGAPPTGTGGQGAVP